MVTKPTHRKVRDVWGTRIVLGTRLGLSDAPLDQQNQPEYQTYFDLIARPDSKMKHTQLSTF